MDYAQWVAALRSSLDRSIERAADHLPSVLGALALLLLGWILARVFRALTRRLIRGLDWLLGSRTVRGALDRIGVERPASEVVSALVFWVVFLFFLTAATETLGLPVIATWIGGLSYYLPRVLVGLLILFAGLLAGSLAGEAIRKAAAAAEVAQAPLLGRIGQVVILLIAAVTAVEQLGIDAGFLTATITIVIGTGIGGIALAFALGARDHVRNIIATHYLRQVYGAGQTVKVAGVQGRILEITTTGVILETADGQTWVPADEFVGKVSSRVLEGA